MTLDYQAFPHAGIRNLIPYKPGKSIEALVQEQGISDIIKMASNENPLGCSPLVKKTLNALPVSTFATYPSPLIHPLNHHLASQLQIDRDCLHLSPGSDSLFQLLLISFCLHRNKQLLTHDYAFSTYAIQAQTLGIATQTVAVHDDWSVNIPALVEACNEDIGLLCLANPNNPTGTLIDKTGLVYLLDHIRPETLVVLDEAYFEYARKQQGYDAIDWLESYPNLVLTRTFSKAYGLAGLRLGYAIAHASIIDILRRIQLPFAVSQVALVAGLAALDDPDFIEQTLQINQNGMEQLSSGFKALDLDYIPSAGNFISFNCKSDGLAIYQYLLSQGIIVRPLHPYGMANYLRVSIGTEKQNSRFLHTVSTYFKECL